MPESEAPRCYCRGCRQSSWRSQPVVGGFSLVELLAVLAIIGLLAALALVRVMDSTTQSAGRACQVNQRDIEIQAQLWYREHGAWPASDLSDVGGDARYFPGGLPTCPVDGSSYQFDSNTHKIHRHAHR